MRLSGFLLSAALLGAQPKPAVLLLPIEYDLSAFLLQAERDLPTQLHSEWVALGQRIPMPVAYRYDLTRSPLELEGAGVGKAIIRARLRYTVDVGVPAPNLQTGVVWKRLSGCRPTREVIMRLETTVDFTPDWTVSSRTSPRLEMPEPCKLTASRTPIRVDISDRVRLAFADGLNKAAAELDRRIRAQAGIRPLIENAWRRLLTPLPLGSGVSLSLNPNQVGVFRPVLAGRVIRTGVRIEGQPTLGDVRPLDRPLPPLTWADQSGEFALEWASVLTWPEATNHLRQALIGKTIKVAGRRTVQIDDLALSPLGDQIELAVNVSGGLKGRIVLRGRPAFNAATSKLEFNDLRFTLDTDNFLIRVADWFRHESTRKKLEQMARIDLLDAMNQQRARLETAFRDHFGDAMTLTGKFEALGPFSLDFDASEIRVHATLAGTLTLAIAPQRL